MQVKILLFFCKLSYYLLTTIFMCTVTIIPKGKNDFVLTSNRDEAPNRISLSPNFYKINDAKMMFPKDELSGGTWIGVSEKNRLLCLLNGAFVCHERKANYRISRGVVVNDLLASDNIVESIEYYNLDNIEPFTLVIVDWNSRIQFYEFVWDGFQKHLSKLPFKPKIWSSSTLYSESMKLNRNLWFEEFKVKNELTATQILRFHKSAGNGNKEYGAVMDRGFVKTTSITQVEKNDEAIEMRYINLQDQSLATRIFNESQEVNE